MEEHKCKCRTCKCPQAVPSSLILIKSWLEMNLGVPKWARGPRAPGLYQHWCGSRTRAVLQALLRYLQPWGALLGPSQPQRTPKGWSMSREGNRAGEEAAAPGEAEGARGAQTEEKEGCSSQLPDMKVQPGGDQALLPGNKG